MREIKFRAWNKKELQMCLNANVMGANTPEIQTEWDFMQYTGLKDKNGIEIFEGDIVRLKSSKINSRRVIEWRGHGFRTRKIHEGKKCRKHISQDIPRLSQPSVLEVIGNIYENPELLK